MITKEVNGVKSEPYEEAIVEVPENYVGAVVELFAQRKGEMLDMQPSLEVRAELTHTFSLAFTVCSKYIWWHVLEVVLSVIVKRASACQILQVNPNL